MVDIFEGVAPPEVPLERPPLVRVIAQVRFSRIASLADEAVIAPIQRALHVDYPTLERDQVPDVVLAPGLVLNLNTPEGGAQRVLWRLSNDTGWRIAIHSQSMSIETSRYTSRTEFFGRFERVLRLLAEQPSEARPANVGRLGVRYINRLEGEEVENLATYVNSSVRGVVEPPMLTRLFVSLSESIFSVDGCTVRARWGLVPSGHTVDPTAIEPVAQPSWILDLDQFVGHAHMVTAFDPDALALQGKNFAETLYRIFRWAVTPAFLAARGGRP